MALRTVFEPTGAQIADLYGRGFVPVNAEGGGNAPGASPDASNAPDLTLAPNSSPLSAMAQGANQASLTGNIATGLGVAPTGLFTGNVTPEGAVSTATNAALSLAGHAVPGFGTANAVASALGAFGGLMTLFGSQGQQTNGELNGEIGEGLGLSGTGPNVNANVAAAIAGTPSGRGDSANGPTGPSGPSGTGPSGAGGGTSADGPPGGGVAGNGEAEATGGTILNRRGTTQGTRDTVHKRLTPGEEVVSKSEASRPGVRPLLKAINQPGDGPVERGLSTLFGKG